MATKPVSKSAKTTDAIEILRAVHRDDPNMERMIAEERTNRAVARQIYDLRMQHTLTQQQLADRVGTTQSVIARLEDADYEGHSLTMLSRIGMALGCAVSIAFIPVKPTNTRSGRHVVASPKRGAKTRKVTAGKRAIPRTGRKTGTTARVA